MLNWARANAGVLRVETQAAERLPRGAEAVKTAEAKSGPREGVTRLREAWRAVGTGASRRTRQAS